LSTLVENHGEGKAIQLPITSRQDDSEIGFVDISADGIAAFYEYINQ
jgi:hypothetical protein